MYYWFWVEVESRSGRDRSQFSMVHKTFHTMAQMRATPHEFRTLNYDPLIPNGSILGFYGHQGDEMYSTVKRCLHILHIFLTL